MSSHQHTVLVLLILIVALRLVKSGRLKRALGALQGSTSGTATPAATAQQKSTYTPGTTRGVS